MKFGIIGLGNHARNRVMPAIVRAGHEVSAIYSRNIEKAKNEGLKYFSKPYNDLETFLNSEIDAVYISSPNFLHYEHAINCLLHGKHVLLEKPMTLENEHAEELVRTAEEKGLTLAIGFHMRFHPLINRVKQLIRDGELGDIVYVSGVWAGLSSRRYDDPDTKWWREDEKVGGGSVMATGVHVLDAFNYILGKSPDSVNAIRNPPGEVIDLTEHITMQYSSTIADAVSSRGVMNAENNLSVYGSRGSAFGKGVFSTSVESSLYLNSGEEEKFESTDMYEEEVKAFAELAKGRSSNIATGIDGSAVVKTVNAAKISAAGGKKVSL